MNYIINVCDWDDLVNRVIISDDGFASCNLYYFKDTPHEMCLGDLYVNENERKKSKGKDLLKFAENLCAKNGHTKLCLKVKIGSWMMHWYFRNGFDVRSIDDEDPDNFVWLEKNINVIS